MTFSEFEKLAEKHGIDVEYLNDYENVFHTHTYEVRLHFEEEGDEKRVDTGTAIKAMVSSPTIGKTFPLRA